MPLQTVSCFVIQPPQSPEDNTSFQILPKGEPGELAVGGYQLATGYINRPEQTSLAFIQTPYGRVYRTGDRAVVKDDGTIECLGRLSEGQVKLRGQRIELGEVEQAALRTPGCHAAVAVVVESTLIGFCAVDPGTDEKSVIETCRKWLPQFMVPGEILTMEKLPTLPSGKADVKKLKHDYTLLKTAENHAHDSVVPMPEQDREIIRLVSDTLGRPVRYKSILASVGLDSLLAISLAAVLRHAGYRATAVGLLKTRTVADLCATLKKGPEEHREQQSRPSKSLDTSSIMTQIPTLSAQRGSVERIRECTPLQLAMLAETLRQPDLYWNEIELECSSSVSIDVIHQAFRQVIQNNDILRSGFALSEHGFVSVIFKQGPETQVAISDQPPSNFTSDTIGCLLEPFKVRLRRNAAENVTHIYILAHHATYDGWSMDMILKDVTEIIHSQTPKRRESFQKVVNYQCGRIDDAEEDVSRAYWTQLLRGWNKTPFPKLIARPETQHISSKRMELPIPISSVREVSQSMDISNQVIFQAALAMVWQGIIGQQDIVFGSVLSGRTLPINGIENILGPCIMTAPLRVDFTNMHSNIDILKSIHAGNRAAMEHGQLPLREIGKLAGLQHNETLYDVLFVYQQSLHWTSDDLRLIKQTRHLDRLETELLVEVEPVTEGYALQITYHPDSISAEFVDIFCHQLRYTVQSLLRQPTGAAQMSAGCESLELSVYKEQCKAADEPGDVVALFEASATRTPDSDAIRFVSVNDQGREDVTTVTYSELDVAANQIAHYLQRQNVRTGELVAIIMTKSTLLYSAILGVLKAGCAYLPILPSTPAARVRTILEQAKTRHCVIDEHMALFNFPDHVTPLDISDVSLSSLAKGKVFVQNDPDRLSYVIYTSGTTGIPKGVAVTQRNLASNVAYLSTLYPVSTPRPRLLQACSHAFDVSVFEIFFAWAAGMCLCAADTDTLHSNLERWIRELHITHLSFTPTVASLVTPENVPEVEFLVTAGEPMTSSVRDKWGSLLWQGYGPSETTNICSVKRMNRHDNIEHLGWVFPNTSVFVLSQTSLDVLPKGWVGEFCFGGSQVAQGYLTDDALTTQKFISHPELGRIYRSGDLGRMLPDGSLIIMGRLDDQMKLRGQRIEANEINSILTEHPSVDTAVTMLVKISRHHGYQTSQLVTFYVQSKSDKAEGLVMPDAEITGSLFATLQSRVPPYMVPSYIVPVVHIPMTSSGKIDRSELGHWFTNLTREYLQGTAAPVNGAEDDSTWSDVELVIADVIARCMGILMADIARWTPFPILGIDSLSAIKISGTLNERMGSNISISAILQHPCVAQLGRYLSQNQLVEDNHLILQTRRLAQELASEVKATMPHQDLPIDDVLPCTPLQEAMLSQTKGSYCNKILLRLHISVSRIKSYWEQLVKRHSIMRTCFVTTENFNFPIAQVILQEWEIPWKEFKVTAPSLEGATHEHMSTLQDPLDSMIPPYSLALIKYKESNFLSFICHHALYDGVAMENLWREVEDLAHGRQLPQPVQYWPFLEQALSLPLDANSFWEDQFRGYRPVTAFMGSARSDVNQFTHTTSIEIPLNEVLAKTRSMGISMLALCQASWASVLAVLYDKTDLAFGNVVSGRTLGLDGIDRLVAPCFNTIPLRIDVSRSGQSVELAKVFHSLNSLAIPYQFSPLRLVQKLVRTRGQVLFDTLLLLQQPLKEMDTNIWTLEQDSGDMDVPVVCEVIPCPNLNSIAVNLHYDMDIMTGELASAVADMFKFMMRTTLMFPLGPILRRNNLPQVLTSELRGFKVRHQKMEDIAATGNDNSEWSDIELRVRKVISDISGSHYTTISRQTTIFHVGLDSINAVQVASVLRNQGFKVSVSDVMECPSCAKLSARIARNSERPNGKATQIDFASFKWAVSDNITSHCQADSEIEAVLPCTPVQNAMLAASIESEERLYLNDMSIDVGENSHSLLTAWTKIQDRHPMLRTGFVPVQHQQSTFAMVRYTHRVQSPVDIMGGQESENFSLTQWKMASKSLLLQDLQQPPWKVALVEVGTRTVMHIVIHHALYDGHSLDGILDGLSNLLHDGLCMFPSIEPALSDLLLRSQRESRDAKTFWGEHANAAVVNNFPVLTPLREQQRGVFSSETVCSLTFDSLQSQTRKLGVSIQAVIQAAWARLLASYIGESSVIFGVTLSGRLTDDTQSAPFPCLTTIPVIARTTKSNVEMIEAMMTYNSNLYKHQFTPLSLIQKWMGHPGSQVFDTLLVYQNRRTWNPLREGWQVQNDEGSVEYSVSLEVEPLFDQSIQLRLTARTDIVPAEQVNLMLQQFDAILCHLAEQPNGQEDDLFRSHMDIFSVTPAKLPIMAAPVMYTHQFVEYRALAHPTKPALEFVHSIDGNSIQRSSYNYKKFNGMGNKVANLLSPIVNVGDIVAIHFQKCPEAYFAILGILKAGCSFVALDTTAPEARKSFILDDSKAKCVLTNAPETITFAKNTRIVVIAEAELKEYPDRPLQLDASFGPHSTCYCLYTSGTTGTPKGCEITHENVVQALMAFQDLFKGQWESDSRWLQFASLHFDVSVLEQYWSWSVGITVVAATKDLILDDLTGNIHKMNITHIDLTPSLARLTHPGTLPNLCKGVFITGGEQLNQEILDSWGPKAVIYNAYGPTEATIGVTMFQRVPINGRPSNIGKQFPNVGSYIFHPGTEIPVLKGAVGELCVSGELVGKGYLHRPDLTKERFPVLSEFKERIYRTGDLVRIMHDGCFDFLGRADDQVKLRGQRLEIGEINHTIRTDAAGVADAATLVLNHSGKDVIVAFLVGEMRDTSELRVLADEDALGVRAREACLKKLPAYMVPTYFVQLSYMPLSANNKVEAKQLGALFNSLGIERLMQLANATLVHGNLDKRILGIVTNALADISAIDSTIISASTSIFDVGIDSITALQLSSKLKKLGLQKATPTIILRSPIVADLVRALSKDVISATEQDQTKKTKQAIHAVHHRQLTNVCQETHLQPEDIEYIAPCSPLQEGIISRAFTDKAKTAYFNSFDFKVQESASIERVIFAWDIVIGGHSILRTLFVRTTDGYVQVAVKKPSDRWIRHLSADNTAEVTGLFDRAREDWIASNNSHILTPLEFVLVQGPGIRQLRLQIFHGLYDGNSIDIMNRQATSLYGNGSPEAGAEFYEALSHGPLWNFEFCKRFWKCHLAGWRPSNLPKLDKAARGAPRVISGMRSLSMDAFEEIRKQHNVTLQAVILSSWIATLQAYLSAPLTVGIIVAGRSLDLPGVGRTVGPLFNTIPFHNKTLNGFQMKTLIQNCHKFNTDILAFQHVPLRDIQKWCSAGKPLFDNLFAFQIEETDINDDDKPWIIESSQGVLDYDLAFEATKTQDGQLRLSLAAHDDIVDATGIERLLDQFETLVLNMDSEAILQMEPLLETPYNDGEAAHNSKSQDSVSETNAAGDWTPCALAIRDEMATFTGISPNKIQLDTTVQELGIDSIDAIKISARLAKHGVRLTASQMNQHQILSKIASVSTATDATFNQQQPGATEKLRDVQRALYQSVKESEINLDQMEAVLPPTALQESMISGMLQSGFEWYFNHDILQLSSGTDVDRLIDAWNVVIQESPILRTAFAEVADSRLDMAYCQVIYNASISHLQQKKIANMQELQDIIISAKRRAIRGNAKRDLLQVTLASLGSKLFMVLSVAHALYDGWSLGLLYDDLLAAYEGRTTSRRSPETFIAHSLENVNPDAKTFWGGYLLQATPTLVPAETTRIGARASIVLRKELQSQKNLLQISKFCKSNGISVQTLCMACWGAVAAHLAGTLDAIFGVVLSGRDFEGADQLMFPTMNTVAMRFVLHSTATPFLRYVEDTLTDVRQYQGLPLRKAQAAANLSGRDLFNSLFILQKSFSASKTKDMFRSVDGSSSVEYSVCVEAELGEQNLTWRIACKGELFSDSGSLEMLEKVDQVLSFFMESPDVDTLAFDGKTVSICGLPHTDISKGTLDKPNNIDAAGQKDSIPRDAWDETSLRICQVLSEVSGVPQESISARSTLYHLGLDSISAIKVSLLLRKCNIQVKPRDLIQANSLLEMAASAGQNQGSPTSITTSVSQWTPRSAMSLPKLMERLDITENDVESILPATPLQVYMMSAWQNSGGSVFYPTFCYEIAGDVSSDEIREAWSSVMEMTPILRTRLATTGGAHIPCVQVILNYDGIRAGRVEQPLVRLNIESADAPESRLIRLSIHHALYDGFSLPNIMSQLVTKLRGKTANGQGNIEQGLSDWANFAISPTSEDSVQLRRQFWTGYLQGSVQTQVNREQPSKQIPYSTERVSYLRREAWNDVPQISAIAADHGISIQSLFLAAYAKSVLSEKSQSFAEDKTVVFGVYLANRGNDIDTHLQTYPTLNLVPLKVIIRDREDIISVATTIQRDLHQIGANEKANVGLWEIEAWTGLRIDTFINFLALPHDDDESDTTSITLIHKQGSDALSTAAPESKELLSQPWLQGNAVRASYPVSGTAEIFTPEYSLTSSCSHPWILKHP